MSRVDKPVLQCDRCKRTTEDLREMSRFLQLEHHHVSGSDKWDLCPECNKEFHAFLDRVSPLTESSPVH